MSLCHFYVFKQVPGRETPLVKYRRAKAGLLTWRRGRERPLSYEFRVIVLELRKRLQYHAEYSRGASPRVPPRRQPRPRSPTSGPQHAPASETTTSDVGPNFAPRTAGSHSTHGWSGPGLSLENERAGRIVPKFRVCARVRAFTREARRLSAVPSRGGGEEAPTLGHDAGSRCPASRHRKACIGFCLKPGSMGRAPCFDPVRPVLGPKNQVDQRLSPRPRSLPLELAVKRRRRHDR